MSIESNNLPTENLRTMETIETRDVVGRSPMQPLSRKSSRYHTNAAGEERRDSSTSTVENPIAVDPPKQRPRSLSYSDLPDNNEYIEIVLRGNELNLLARSKGGRLYPE